MPPVVGVPETTPSAETVSPGGAPVRDQPVIVAPPPAPDVVAFRVSGEMAVPATETWSGGVVTVTTFSMFQVTTVVPVNPSESVAWTVAE